MTLKNNRAHLLCYIKLCASFQSHQRIQTGVTVLKCSIRVKIGEFLSCLTLKFDEWPWKTKGHLFCVASSFVHHFIGQFKLKLQSVNAQLGSKSVIYCPSWPWNLSDDLEKQKGTSSMLLQALCIISYHQWIQTKVTVRKCSIRIKIVDFLSRVTLKFDGWPWKTKRAPLLCYFKLCALLRSHWWIPTGVIVRKRQIWVKSNDFFRRVT